MVVAQVERGCCERSTRDDSGGRDKVLDSLETRSLPCKGRDREELWRFGSMLLACRDSSLSLPLQGRERFIERVDPIMRSSDASVIREWECTLSALLHHNQSRSQCRRLAIEKCPHEIHSRHLLRYIEAGYSIGRAREGRRCNRGRG